MKKRGEFERLSQLLSRHYEENQIQFRIESIDVREYVGTENQIKVH